MSGANSGCVRRGVKEMGLLRRPKDLVTGILLLVIGLGVMVDARNYTMGDLRNMGPGFFPLVLGGLLLLFGLIVSGMSLRGDRETSEGQVAIRPLILVLGASILFGVLLRPIGLIGAIMVMVIVAAAASSESRPLPSVILALLLGFGSAAAFVYGLGQELLLVGYWFTG
ncbi:MAG: tripartite tricarboxylate transporter TctB family protein [Pseudomonadota bacterium]|nr:tripartite tricarboxylate transporter TctB family protein [Pseudomonadota bacterium]